MDILILPGDDIGPEISTVTKRVLQAADEIFGLDLRFEEMAVGVAAYRDCGCTVPDGVVEAAMNADGVILGPAGITNYPEGTQGWLNVPGTIRKRLDLYANLRPARTRPGVPGARDGLDVMIVRENTEGFYSDRNMFKGIGEFMPTPDVALSVRKITAQASNRIARTAFEVAQKRGGHVTAVGKRHVLQISDGLFMQEVEKVAAEYSNVSWREMDIDAISAKIYSSPDLFDVILTTNMFGDILSNAAAAMSGSLGLAAALNAGDERAVANAGHGSAPDLAGRGIANPTGLILSAAMLLEWLAERHGLNSYADAAGVIHKAIDIVLADPALRTADLGGENSTEQFAEALITNLKGMDR